MTLHVVMEVMLNILPAARASIVKGKEFPPREPRVNYEELRAASDASYFAMLFDKRLLSKCSKTLRDMQATPTSPLRNSGK